MGATLTDTVASRASGRKALAQTENTVCTVSGGGEGGPVVCDRYLVAASPRAPFLSKSALMGKQRCWPQVVNWDSRGARKLSVLSAPVSEVFPTSHQAEPQPCGTLTPAEHFPQHCSSSATHKSPAPKKSEDYSQNGLLEAKNWLSMVP